MQFIGCGQVIDKVASEQDFKSEDELVKDFCNIIGQGQTPWGQSVFNTEFNFIRGKTDIVAKSGSNKLIAFEAKLNNWKKALNQAYRCTSFANESYVIMPKNTAIKLEKYISEFHRRSVGLCYIDDDKIVVLIESNTQDPIQPWLFEKAVDYIEGSLQNESYKS